MNRVLIAAVAASAFLTTSAIAGPSAKFAATYGGPGPFVVSMVDIPYTTENTMMIDRNAGFTLATIKVPQDKELLVGVSAEVGLTTDTSIKGRNGGAAKAIAGARARALVFACPTGFEGPADYDASCTAFAAPGRVTLSQRIQELSATLGGVIESCEDGLGDNDDPTDGIGNDPDGVIDVATECTVSDEEIGLMLDTLASHHFNFVLPNMDQGEYDIVVVFLTGAAAQVEVDAYVLEDDNFAEASAYARAWVGNYMVTVQQVRAAKGGIIDADIVEP